MFSPHVDPPRAIGQDLRYRVAPVNPVQAAPVAHHRAEPDSRHSPDEPAERTSTEPLHRAHSKEVEEAKEAEEPALPLDQSLERALSERRRPTVADLMTTEVVTVGPEQTVRELLELLEKHGVSGVPVVEEPGRMLLGVVSQSDVASHVGASLPKRKTGPNFYQSLWIDLDESLSPDLYDTPVRAIMTPYVYFATEDTSLKAVTDLVLENDIHRVVVTRDGALAGVLSATDLLRAYRHLPW